MFVVVDGYGDSSSGVESGTASSTDIQLTGDDDDDDDDDDGSDDEGPGSSGVDDVTDIQKRNPNTMYLRKQMLNTHQIDKLVQAMGC